MSPDIYTDIIIPTSIILVLIILLVSFKKNRKYIKQLEEIAYIDELTNLPNRKAFTSKIDLSKIHYFMLIDLARFKFFNEIETNKKGDEYLKILSKKLLSFVESKNIDIYRFYGDLFILTVKDPFSDSEIRDFASNLSSLICNNLFIEDCTVSIRCNIGIYEYVFKEEHISTQKSRSECINDITNNLHLAVDIAKSFKTANIHLIESVEYEKHMENQILESKITSDIVKEAIIPFYQPKFDTRTNHIIGAETLARWRHDITGTLYPDQFVGILEKRREIDLLDYLVLEKACADLKYWIENNIVSDNFTLSFNFSIITIEKNDIYKWFVDLHKKYNVPYNRLEMEITETVFTEDLGHISEKVANVSSLGVKVALDDYTTGSANIRQLAKLKIDNIKIDKSILSTGMDSPAKFIFENLLDLCQRFNITMIVEGVETKEQIQFLQQLGIFNVQGYFFAPPLSYTNFTNMLNNK